MAIVRQDDRLVEAGLLGLRLGERRVHVRTGDLAAGGDRVVVDAPPARDAAADAAVDLDVRAERNGEDGERGFKVVQPHADELAALVHERPHVAVLAIAAPREELDGDVHEPLRGVREVEAHDPAGPVEPAVVLEQVQPVQLAVLGIPIRADPLEDTGAVVEGVRQDAHLRVAQGNELPVEERPRGVRCRAAAQRGRRPGQLLHHDAGPSVRFTFTGSG